LHTHHFIFRKYNAEISGGVFIAGYAVVAATVLLLLLLLFATSTALPNF